MVVGPAEWRLLRKMDGTRDLEGLSIATGRTVDAVARFVTELEELGAVGPRTGRIEPANAFAPSKPIRRLPGYRFACTGAGDCCNSFVTIQFTPLEAVRAAASAPDPTDEDPLARFTPDRGLDASLYAVACLDGACAYYDRAARECRVHSVKPAGCASFPLRFVAGPRRDPLRASPRVRVRVRVDRSR